MPGWSFASPRGGSIVGPKKSVVAAGAELHAATAHNTAQIETDRMLHFCL